ncbi:MAG: hypothetical protein A2Y62_09245 [Candidatus Fischerbacteria bacterium RBG_13_37_8]|uniref:Uncharacterized protein n=1 Tax=Candidatus Fischerbacteria bacterium RBG_13_37_8 TaxID=1817863 RepID=A0A1F5VFR4_9BACT|nr:MAG: hypothetical protein A2Y62_09245 [Candidatus Fischerbacteria bacterium RBG_13_37_8]
MENKYSCKFLFFQWGSDLNIRHAHDVGLQGVSKHTVKISSKNAERGGENLTKADKRLFTNKVSGSCFKSSRV